MTDRFAVLVLAHHQPRVLAALLASLRHPAIDVYVHVDADSDLDPFLAAAPQRAGLTYLRGRRPVRWGGRSVVLATLDLLAAAADSKSHYRRFTLLSGQDLLIAPLDTVLRVWSGRTEYLRIDRRVREPGTVRARQIARRHFPDDRVRWRQLLDGRIPRRVDDTVDLLQGSQWWSLTDAAVEHVHGFLAANPAWLRFHRHTRCPDEVVFHSIVAASPVAHRIAQPLGRPGATDGSDPVHGLHHIDWSDPAAISPRVLGAPDEASLRASPALFARKVDDSSLALIDAFAANPAGPR
ncbi:beta-1,6-N-acetylglucosaminyltransferase [Rhodococcus sp. NPDC058505]|uniref:beta-1,6-N-acetylglucosaminyltransferase n=1 Tax=unclassified Rhodococcus (in: high G+C Gram-positive bacteria) TaxID=192944 RepID=UPI00364DB42E